MCCVSLTFYRILIRGQEVETAEPGAGQMNEGKYTRCTCQHQNQIPMQREPDEKKKGRQNK